MPRGRKPGTKNAVKVKTSRKPKESLSEIIPISETETTYSFFGNPGLKSEIIVGTNNEILIKRFATAKIAPERINGGWHTYKCPAKLFNFTFVPRKKKTGARKKKEVVAVE